MLAAISADRQALPCKTSRSYELFGNVEMRRVRHQDTKMFPSGIVALKYARA